MTPEGNLNGDVVQESFPSIHQANPMAQKPGTQHPANGIPAGLTAQADEDESVSVHVSIRITQRVYGNRQQRETVITVTELRPETETTIQILAIRMLI